MEINLSDKEDRKRLIKVGHTLVLLTQLKDDETSLAESSAVSEGRKDTNMIRSLPLYVVFLVVVDLAVTIGVWLSQGYKLGVLNFIQMSVQEFSFHQSLFDLVCTRRCNTLMLRSSFQ